MRKCINLFAIGVLLSGCHTSSEIDADLAGNGHQEGGALRPSFSDCMGRAAAVTPEVQLCIEQEFDFQEARMKDALEKLPLAKQEDQRAWQERDAHECQWDPETEGQAQRLEANYCSMARVAKRADELERRLDL